MDRSYRAIGDQDKKGDRGFNSHFIKMIQIFYSYISEENHDRFLKEIAPIFSIEFQRKVLQYRRWQDAQLSLLGRLLLKNGLEKRNKRFNEESLRYSLYNKPYFERENVKFNISHSGNIAVCAIAETCEIGIDIEVIHGVEVENYRSQMTESEWQRIISSDNIENSFFDYWTQKEAVIKAQGMGFSIPLRSFEVIKNHTKINKENFFLKEIELDVTYKCHLASKDKINPAIIKIQEIDPFIT